MYKHCSGGINNGCGQNIQPPPPPPPPHHHHHHPYENDVHCSDHHHPPMHPPMRPYPTNGKMVENGFMLIDTSPFLYDNTNVSYGQRVIVSEHVETQIYQRKDPCCLNLAGTFDMTDSVVTNTVLQHYLKEFISKNAKTLNGVLPIIRHYIKFSLAYTICDGNDGIIYRGHKDVICDKMQYHATEIMDYFVSSCKGHIQINIPPITYPGIYKFILNSITASVDTINTEDHITENLNPYYQFTDNNTKIAIQHDAIINDQTSDGETAIAIAEIDKAFIFKANMVNKVCVSFTAYMSNLISMYNTFDLWESFDGVLDNESIEDIDEKLDQLLSTVDDLNQLVKDLQTQNDKLQTNKVDKEEGKGLSSNDYTDEDKELLHTLVNKGQIVFDEKNNFPNPGISGILYVATDLCLTYLWDDNTGGYVSLNNFDIEKVRTIIEEGVQTAIENNETIADLSERVEKLESQGMSWAYLGDK